MSEDYFDSTEDRRVENNTLRHQYRTLTDMEKSMMMEIKDNGETLLSLFRDCLSARPESGREFALARTKLEEAVMWAVKGVTK